jgi:hypothetical protein
MSKGVDGAMVNPRVVSQDPLGPPPWERQPYAGLMERVIDYAREVMDGKNPQP